MRRRDFFKVLGSSVAAWPLAARTQQKAMPVIGLLSGSFPGPFVPALGGFRQGLNESGFVEGRNVAIEYRWAEGHFDRLPGLAAELVNLQVALIATVTLSAALAAKAATATIPIVFVIGEDPVNAGLVASLNRPGGNVTGLSNFMNQLAGKRLQLIGEVAPKPAVLALLVNPDNPNAEADTRDVQAAADALGRELLIVKASSEQELDTAFATLAQKQVGALSVNIDSFYNRRRDQIIALAAKHVLPAIYALREFVTGGGLMSYGASFTEAFRQAGIYAGEILNGAKPADLPVQQPTRFELVINLKTAKALGLAVPQTILARADEVIE